jgi:hypothetical protein
MASIINHLKKAGKNAFPHNVQEVESSADKHNVRRNAHYTDHDIGTPFFLAYNFRQDDKDGTCFHTKGTR